LRAPILVILILRWSLAATGQSTAPDPLSTFKVDVRLVPLRVVVRDGQGRSIGNLHQEDFKILDQDKPQIVTQFSVEHVRGQGANASAQLGDSPATVAPQARYTAYLFDDLHLERNDLIQARKSADGQLASLSPTTERVAILTTSGQKGIDFTADRAKLHETLAHLEPQGKSKVSDCPNINSYTADLIANKGDAAALQVATNDALACAFDGNIKFAKAAQQMAKAVAREEAMTGQMTTLESLRILKALIQGMSKAPGQRTIVIVSPGFSTAEDPAQVNIIDLAVLGDVTVSALDPRGIAPAMDISGPAGGRVDQRNAALESLRDLDEQSVLEELAYGTGGVFFHNNNDLDEGFRRVSARPEYSYVLAFSPKDVKFDGRFHKLKVTVNSGSKLTVLARKGYYAPKQKP
jgi:VWFA-related protein